jgi:hypothetical protein
MNLDDQLRAVLNQEADMDTSTPPDVDRVNRMISGGRTRRRRRNIFLAGGCVLAAVVVVAGGYGALQLRNSDSHSEAPIVTQPTDPPSPGALPDVGEGAVAVDAGTYLVPAAGTGSRTSAAAYTVTVPDGWTAQSGTDLLKNEDTPHSIGIYPWALDDIGIFDDTCHGEEGVRGPAPTNVAGLVSALRAQKAGPLVSDPVATTLGGLPATRVDLDYPNRMALVQCRIGTGLLQVWDGYFVFFPNSTASIYVVNVAGSSQVLLVETADGASAAERAELQSILDSISFEPDQ